MGPVENKDDHWTLIGLEPTTSYENQVIIKDDVAGLRGPKSESERRRSTVDRVKRFTFSVKPSLRRTCKFSLLRGILSILS
jgi:hypothetical protein